MGKILHFISLVLAVLGVIASFVLSNTLGHFNFIIFLIYLFSTLITCALIYAIGTILENQDEIKDYLYEQQRLLQELSKSKATAPTPAVSRVSQTTTNTQPSTSSAPAVETKVEDIPKIVKVAPAVHPKTSWICPACKAENPMDRRSCRECGAPK